MPHPENPFEASQHKTVNTLEGTSLVVKLHFVLVVVTFICCNEGKFVNALSILVHYICNKLE